MDVKLSRAFVAYPAHPQELTDTIVRGVGQVESWNGNRTIFERWAQLDVFGQCISDKVRKSIRECDYLICDITFLNFNVAYEIGFAIGCGKPIAPIMNRSFENSGANFRREGLFDTVGFDTYSNSEELEKLLRNRPKSILLNLYGKVLNNTQPMYVLDFTIKSDYRNSIFSTVKSSRAFFRSFDPVETSRFVSTKIIGEVTSSSGIIVPLLSAHHQDNERHNLRAAFLSGLAHGLGREVLILQRDSGPVPLDYRNEVVEVFSENDVSEAVADFAHLALSAMQKVSDPASSTSRSGLRKLSLGQSAAENEFRTLQNYFFETSEFLKTLRGEVRVVAGRKGSGKTAIFFQVRDKVRADKINVVIDLKPESHQLSLFREELLKVSDLGLFDHTIAAFWNFILLSEIVLGVYPLEASSEKFANRNTVIACEKFACSVNDSAIHREPK